MAETFEIAIKEVLHHEGGFVNHPDDPGGITNRGVTKRVYEKWIGREASEQEMRDLTEETAMQKSCFEYDIRPLNCQRICGSFPNQALPRMFLHILSKHWKSHAAGFLSVRQRVFPHGTSLSQASQPSQPASLPSSQPSLLVKPAKFLVRITCFVGPLVPNGRNEGIWIGLDRKMMRSIYGWILRRSLFELVSRKDAGTDFAMELELACHTMCKKARPEGRQDMILA